MESVESFDVSLCPVLKTKPFRRCENRRARNFLARCRRKRFGFLAMLGTVADAEVKKRFGHDGKIAISITTVQLVNNETAPVRLYYEAFGNSDSGAPVQLSSGREIAPGTDLKALVDGDVSLKREGFVSARETAGTPSADNSQSPQTPQ